MNVANKSPLTAEYPGRNQSGLSHAIVEKAGSTGQGAACRSSNPALSARGVKREGA